VMVVFMNHDGQEKISVEPPASSETQEPLPEIPL
jgi:hypothetical protein